ncbi:peptidoglycan DD-metalloendopeptidase family protein [Alicyclobacillus dauci]|uniref:Peptidoglycan DD-metalloendopeptidase family protein n=1 Tax=Alicyclobacillus dauci TaxID=1475485 RepID=A0ABY6Z147_9BACL|nr:peptidoglycan DD-metalloendopeptidase family protein [Alicyclobacillus dauci]WAH36600.1 peptidoglycan DD-metalloendopeptidase family protein [Alicyclobacillus dauci]
MKWTAALQAVKTKLATARPKVKATHRWKTTGTSTTLLKFKSPRLFIAGTTSLLVIGSGAVLISSHVQASKSCLQIYRDGQYIGLVPNNPETVDTMNRVAAGYGVQFESTPVYTQVRENYPWQRVESFPTAAAVIELNNQPLVYTTSTESANQVLNNVKQALAGDIKSASHVTTSFVGDVKVVATTIGIADIVQPSDATRLLLHPQSTDPMSGRASSPAAQLNSGSHQATTQRPALSVQTHATVTKTVSLPYHVKYVKDSQLAKGDKKVVTDGKCGTQKETVSEIYLNGQQTAEHVLTKDTVTQPVDEVVKLGTNAGVASGGWIWPTDSHLITSPFGYRSFGGGQFHPGIDIGVPTGTTIHATNDGTVISAGWNSGGYGNWVEIDNGSGITTVFGHMSRVAVHNGEVVSKGEVIGYSGESGEATGPHLHYEVRMNGTAVNPMPYT